MNNKVKLGIAVLAVLLGGWLLWGAIGGGGEGGGEAVSALPTAEVGVTAEEGRAILALLNDLKNIRLDETFFTEAPFLSLIDWSVPLEPEPKGRPDPFAPIGVDLAP